MSSMMNGTSGTSADVEPDGQTRGPMSSLDIAYVVLVFIVSLMSILGGLTILGVHIAYKDLRTVGKNMLLHLTVADILTAFGNILGVVWYLSIETQSNVMAFCKLHSALTIMSSIASFIWNVVIAWFVFWIILRMKPSGDQRNKGVCKNIILPIFCWGIAIIIAAAALICDVLGYDKALASASWCWIDPGADNPFMWMMVTGKAWELAACFATFSLYTAVRIILFNQMKKRQSTLNTNNRKLEEANTKLTFVPLTFITLRIWGTIRFLIGNFAHSYASSSASDWIVLMQGTGDSAQGFANFVIYCFFTRKIRARLLGKCPCAIFHISEVSQGRATTVVSKGEQSKTGGRRFSNKITPSSSGDLENAQAAVVIQPEVKEGSAKKDRSRLTQLQEVTATTTAACSAASTQPPMAESTDATQNTSSQPPEDTPDQAQIQASIQGQGSELAQSSKAQKDEHTSGHRQNQVFDQTQQSATTEQVQEQEQRSSQVPNQSSDQEAPQASISSQVQNEDKNKLEDPTNQADSQPQQTEDVIFQSADKPASLSDIPEEADLEVPNSSTERDIDQQEEENGQIEYRNASA